MAIAWPEVLRHLGSEMLFALASFACQTYAIFRQDDASNGQADPVGVRVQRSLG